MATSWPAPAASRMPRTPTQRAAEAGDAGAAAKLGVLRERREDRDGALEAYRQADEAGDGFGSLRLGLLLAARDEWDDAQEAFDRARERGDAPAGGDLLGALRARDDRERSMPRLSAPALSNPVLVGAMTLLIAMVAVFLSYNANNGLPFVPTRELKVDIASGSDLVAGNEVREGGFRIGLVQELKPIQLKSGQIAAQLTIQLEKAYGNVPVDSTASIRPRSALGLKFIDLHKGSSHRVFSDGAIMPITQTHVPVQFEDVFQAFDGKTRKAIDENLVGFGDALAGRGSALNDTIAALPSLLGHLQPVAAYLSDPEHPVDAVVDQSGGVHGDGRAGGGGQRASVYGYGDDL